MGGTRRKIPPILPRTKKLQWLTLENELTHAFIKSWSNLSYMYLDDPSQKAIVRLCRNNLKSEIRSLIIGLNSKSLAKLIETTYEVKNVLKEVKNPATFK